MSGCRVCHLSGLKTCRQPVLSSVLQGGVCVLQVQPQEECVRQAHTNMTDRGVQRLSLPDAMQGATALLLLLLSHVSLFVLFVFVKCC